jgi:hypothetical protein
MLNITFQNPFAKITLLKIQSQQINILQNKYSLKCKKVNQIR